MEAKDGGNVASSDESPEEKAKRNLADDLMRQAQPEAVDAQQEGAARAE